ncbi:MAG TPA: hypothetical protein VN920_08975 [Pyrinomonadaceae bacterium]|nr:hypothetical protein [Pyrinomonadaceae bacterium]
MPQIKAGIAWFKNQFGTQIQAGITGTPFSLDMLSAIAVQETFEIWGGLHNEMPADEILKLCVGDTLDAPNRSAFPKNKAELLSVPQGDQMFAIAREALESLAPHNASYRKIANSNPNKFCHGYGIFQYDIQFFKTNPDYFLQKKWYQFDQCLAQCVHELKAALKRAYPAGKQTLTDQEMVFVAIAYNRGSVNFAKGFKQGFKDQSGKFYGEFMSDYLQLAQSVSV